MPRTDSSLPLRFGEPLAPGQVRFALLDQRTSTDGAAPVKARPVVLIAELGESNLWVVVALTTTPIRTRVIDGTTRSVARVPLQNWATAGLRCPSYISGAARVVPLDVFEGHAWCGWITSTDARTIAAHAGRCSARLRAEFVDGAVARDRRRLAHRTPYPQETAS